MMASPEPGADGVLNPRQVETAFLRRVLMVLFLTALLLSIFAVAWFSIRIWLVTFAGVLLAIFLRTLSCWVSCRTRLPQVWAMVAVVVVILGLGALGGWLLADPVTVQFSELSVRIPEALDRFKDWTRGQPLLKGLPRGQDAVQGLLAKSTEIGTNVLAVFSHTFEFLTGLLVVLFLGLYLAGKPEPYLNGLVRLFPVCRRAQVQRILGEIGMTLRHWVLGQIVSMTVVGILTGVGLKLLGVPLPLALGIISGVLDFVPVFGPVAAAIPAMLLAFLTSPWHALYVVVLFVIVNQIEGHVLIPLIQNYTVSLPPAVTVLALVLFGSLFGFLGLLLATPLAACLLVLVKTAYVEDLLERNGAAASIPADLPPEEQRAA